MTAQLSYANKPGGPFAGLLADLSLHDIDAVRNLDTVALPYGVGLVEVTTDATSPHGVALPTTASATFMGVALHEHKRNQSIAGTGAVVVNEVLNVLRRGRIYVNCETAITDLTLANRTVHMRIGGVGQLGGFRNAAVAGQTVTLNGARFNATCLAGGVVELEIPDSVTMTAD